MDNFNANVVYAEDEDFDQSGIFIKANGIPSICLIWASWCGHCKTLKPTYAKVAETLGDKIRFMCIQSDGAGPSDAVVAKRIGQMIKLEGFPTIVKINDKGVIVDKFNGNRDYESISQWAVSPM